jgi:hypothetical protein
MTTVLATAISALISAAVPALLLILGYNLLWADPLDIREAAGVYLLTAAGYLIFSNVNNAISTSRLSSTVISQMMLGKKVS